jgi:hypothetical protein
MLFRRHPGLQPEELGMDDIQRAGQRAMIGLIPSINAHT